MGEYAKRKIDGTQVKIGTCEDMMYCRYEQIGQVEYGYQTDDLYWRIPNPDEDDIMVGDFEPSLLNDGIIPGHLRVYIKDEELKQELIKSKGMVQTVIKQLGILMNVTCHHNLKLPDDCESVKFGWNGKNGGLYLYALKNSDTELRVVLSCSACRKMCSCSFDEIVDSFESPWMKLRLLHQCSDYWMTHNEEPCNYQVCLDDKEGLPMEIVPLEEGRWMVQVNDEPVKIGSWVECRNEFIDRLPEYDINDRLRRDNYHYTIAQMRQRYLKK